MDDDDDEECLVILFRTPVASESGAAARQTRRAGNLTVSSVFGGGAGDGHRPDTRCRNDRHRGLSFLPDGPVNFPFLPSSGSSNLRVLHAPSGLLVAAAGFAPDADHVLNVAAGRVLSRISVFDAPPPPSSRGGKSVDPHRLVREDLSSMMIDAAMSDGGRPLGVQLLVAGLSSRRRTTAADDDDDDGRFSLEVYTVDPSGGWRSCVGSGTAVGRGAGGVRSSLRRETRDSVAGGGSSLGPTDGAPPRGWMGALDRAMTASMIALDRDCGPSGDGDARGGGAGADYGDGANYGAALIFGAPPGPRSEVGASRCATVSSAIIEECYNRCRRRLIDRKKLTE